MKLRNAIKELAIISVGNVIVAAAVFFFMLPSHVCVGGGVSKAGQVLINGVAPRFHKYVFHAADSVPFVYGNARSSYRTAGIGLLM